MPQQSAPSVAHAAARRLRQAGAVVITPPAVDSWCRDAAADQQPAPTIGLAGTRHSPRRCGRDRAAGSNTTSSSSKQGGAWEARTTQASTGGAELQLSGLRLRPCAQQQHDRMAVHAPSQQRDQRQQGDGAKHLPSRLYVLGQRVPAAAAAAVGGASLLGCGASWQQLHDATAALRQLRAAGAPAAVEHAQCIRVARLAVQQWCWFSVARRQQRLAAQQRPMWLLHSGLLGLQGAVHHHQELRGRAEMQATKQAFVQLTTAFAGWQLLLTTKQRHTAITATQQARHTRRVLRGVLAAWQEHAASKQRARQQLLRAEACCVYMTMLRALQQWRQQVMAAQLGQLKTARAVQHWRRVVQLHVLACWQQRVAAAAAKCQLLATALCFHKHVLLTTAMSGWSTAVAQQQASRLVAAAALQRVQQQQQRLRCCVSAGDVLRAWAAAAQQAAQASRLAAVLQQQRQQRLQQQVVAHWRTLVHRRRQLAVAAEQLQQLAPKLRLHHTLSAWCRVTTALSGQRCGELRQLVQLRAALGTWLQHTERRRDKAGGLQALQHSLCEAHGRRLLCAWQAASVALQHTREQQQAAEHHHERRLQQHALQVWQSATAEAAVAALQAEAAEEWHRRQLLQASVRGLVWYCWHRQSKTAAPVLHRRGVLRRVVAAWLSWAAAEQQMRQHWDRAQQHSDAGLQSRAMRAWVLALEAAVLKQRVLAAAAAHHQLRMLRRTLHAWRGPFLQHQRTKQRLKAAADGLAVRHALAAAMSAWEAAVAARRAKVQQLTCARQHHEQQLLGRTWQQLVALQQQAAQERRRLAAAAAPARAVLARLRQQLMLRTWRQLAAEQQWQRETEVHAAAHARRACLKAGLSGWQAYLLRCRRAAAAEQAAADHRRQQLLRAALAGLRRRVVVAVTKRRLVFAAAMHRRAWLIRRGFKAWRLATVLPRVAAAGPSDMQAQALPTPDSSYGGSSGNMQCDSRNGSGTQHMQPTGSMEAIAAAMVDASCASLADWHRQWRQKCEAALAVQPAPLMQQTHQQQQPAASESALAHQQHQQHQHQQQQQQQQEAVVLRAPPSPPGMSSSSQLAAHAPPRGAHEPAASSVCSSRVVRPQPRLPPFMQASLLQQTPQRAGGMQRACNEASKMSSAAAGRLQQNPDTEQQEQRQQQQDQQVWWSPQMARKAPLAPRWLRPCLLQATAPQSDVAGVASAVQGQQERRQWQQEQQDTQSLTAAVV